MGRERNARNRLLLSMRCASLSWCLCHVVVTHAQAPTSSEQPATKSPGASASDAEPARYRGLIREALLEYENRNFEEARTLFSQAHDAFPNARTLRGLGMASFELRDYPTAERALERALASSRKRLDGELRVETEALLARTRRFLGSVRVRMTPSHATLIVDGIVREPHMPIRLTVGGHTLEARSPGSRTTRQVIVVQGGKEHQIEITLPPEASASAPIPASQRIAVGPSLSLLLPDRGYADEARGVAFGLSLWWQRERWVLDSKASLDFDVGRPNRSYLHAALELAAHRTTRWLGQQPFLGLGTGIAYAREKVVTTQTVGSLLRTTGSSTIESHLPALPLFARVGVMLFPEAVASVLISGDYVVTLADFTDRWHERATRLNLGVVFGRSR